jgi:hypothetical protein
MPTMTSLPQCLFFGWSSCTSTATPSVNSDTITEHRLYHHQRSKPGRWWRASRGFAATHRRCGEPRWRPPSSIRAGDYANNRSTADPQPRRNSERGGPTWAFGSLIQRQTSGRGSLRSVVEVCARWRRAVRTGDRRLRRCSPWSLVAWRWEGGLGLQTLTAALLYGLASGSWANLARQRRQHPSWARQIAAPRARWARRCLGQAIASAGWANSDGAGRLGRWRQHGPTGSWSCGWATFMFLCFYVFSIFQHF